MSDPSARIVPAAWATAVGLFLAPLVGGAVGTLVWAVGSDLINGNLTGENLFRNFYGALTFGLTIGGIVGLVPAFVVGWPLHVLLLRKRWTQLWVYLVLGAGLALIAAIVYGILSGGGVSVIIGVFAFPVLFAGALGAIVFWLIRRPDRDAQQTSEPTP